MSWKAGHDWPPEPGKVMAYLVTLMDEDSELFVDIADYLGGGRWRLKGESYVVYPYAWMELPPPSLGATTEQESTELSTDLSTGKGARKGTIDPE